MPVLQLLHIISNIINKKLHSITFLLLVIGGLNWLLVGVLNWDVGQLFGGMDATISKIVYILVGLSALYEIFTHGKRCKDCKKDGAMVSGGQM